MRAISFALLGAAALAGCAAALPADNQARAWRAAVAAGAPQDYAAYHALYPGAAAGQGAAHAAPPASAGAAGVYDPQQEAWLRARSASDPALYEQYLRGFPQSQHADEARYHLNRLHDNEQAAWDRARSLNSVEAYQDYRTNYPNGRYSAQAGGRIDQLRAPTPGPLAPPRRPGAPK